MNHHSPKELLFSMVEGFRTSRVLLTAVEIDLFTPLCSREYTAAELALEKSIDPRATEILCNALTAMGLLRKINGYFSVPPELQGELTSEILGNAYYSIKYAGNLWQRWHYLTEIVATGKCAFQLHQFPDEAARTQNFINAMHSRGTMIAETFANSFDCSSYHSIIDIGGGSGVFLIALLLKNPHLHGTFFDRPQVVEIARKYIADYELHDRIHFVSGDFNVDQLPSGFDLVLLSAIIHMNSPEQNIDLFKKINHSMICNGKLFIRDFIMNDDKTSPRHGALFAVNMLVNTIGGNTYSFSEISSWLQQCGFTSNELHETKDHELVVTAIKTEEVR